MTTLFPSQTSCAIRAISTVEASAQELPVLRKQLNSADVALPNNLLNHADDHTITALTAVLRAIKVGDVQGPFDDWGVVASARFPGRVPCAISLDKFQRQGSLAVSPVIIPYYSLHSMSSAISLALGMHGASLGVGGGADGYLQVMLAGLAAQQEASVPGVWVVATGFDPELVQDLVAAEKAVCRAVVFAVMPASGKECSSYLRLVPRVDRKTPMLSFLELYHCATDAMNGKARTWRAAVSQDFDLELSLARALTLAA